METIGKFWYWMVAIFWLILFLIAIAPILIGLALAYSVFMSFVWGAFKEVSALFA